MTLKELKRLAESATAGPWATYGRHDENVRTEAHLSEFRVHKIKCRKDAAYIAAANPSVILKLIEDRERLIEALVDIDISKSTHKDFDCHAYARQALEQSKGRWE